MFSSRIEEALNVLRDELQAQDNEIQGLRERLERLEQKDQPPPAPKRVRRPLDRSPDRQQAV